MEPGVIKDDEIEIDLLMLVHVLLAKLWMIILAGVITGLSAFLYTTVFMDKQYESSAQLYIINRQNEGTTTLSDLQSSTQLVKDYQVLVVSRPVVQQVITNLNLNISEERFIKNVDVKIAPDSRVLTLKVTHTDPYIVKKIVDDLADVSSARICNVMQIDGVNIIQYGNIPDRASSPNVKKYTVVAGAAGMLLVAAIVVIFNLLDDSVKNPEDVERYLGVSTLALIPQTEEEFDGKKGKNKRKKVTRRGDR